VSETDRLVPKPPPEGRRIRLIIDSDAAAEIDDLYAIALALSAPDRFEIEGFVATHFAASATGAAGPESTNASYRAIEELLEAAGLSGAYPVTRGAHPMQYLAWPSPGEGVDFILERARAGSPERPLWVVSIGACTNIASAICRDPAIAPNVRFVFHSRSAETWPERSVQFNVKGDVTAARTLLQSAAPLVWLDTGTNLCRSFDQTARTLAPTGELGRYLHGFRRRNPCFMRDDKGFFDLADIAWMLQPALCRDEVVPAPTMDPAMFFNHERTHGMMRRVYAIENEPTWALLCDRLRRREA